SSRGRQFTESITQLHNVTAQLSTHPESNRLYNIRLLPLSIERSALLASLDSEEKYALQGVHTAYAEERDRVEEEWRRGRERVRERLLEGIEEPHNRRLPLPSTQIFSDASLDSQSRPPITRKLRNKGTSGGGTSPPPTPLNGIHNPMLAGLGLTPAVNIANVPVTTGPFLNPHSLSVDDLPSPFPLPLTATTAPRPTDGGMNGRARRPKGAGVNGQNMGGLGKALAHLSGCKELETDTDLGEIRRVSKRRRQAVGVLSKN
ncbi:hypothetical protein FISHEDRAFT_50216, partial [Fistulina hepatica ATCC 64428]